MRTGVSRNESSPLCAQWCRGNEKSGSFCGCAYKPQEMAQMLNESNPIMAVIDNEVIVNAQKWNALLPNAIEAFFIDKFKCILGSDCFQDFVRWYIEFTEINGPKPVLVFDRTARTYPFSLYDDAISKQTMQAPKVQMEMSFQDEVLHYSEARNLTTLAILYLIHLKQRVKEAQDRIAESSLGESKPYLPPRRNTKNLPGAKVLAEASSDGEWVLASVLLGSLLGSCLTIGVLLAGLCLEVDDAGTDGVLM
eukprot:gnl/MRDRNA2_/MRDRNA2_56347_c0_seq1.p1 gnl/MRDRNA2_/MRDRNA2_56347_c0~~gnl/MRDRNA2_/MRDRNA2_56347_c0_seq1.p1  ORF type:complete len:251 (+),score=39.59 gnl/MRDRNA2_/MRDRNA2_56347_c0_seq1:479-1231(+)